MNKMNRYALIAALAMFLSGCVAQREPAPVEEVKPVPEQPAQPQQPVPVVPTVPSIPQQPGPIEHEDQTAQPTPRQRHYDWNGAMQPMVGKMLQADGVKAGGVLLVDSVNNRTNGSLNAGEATETLRNALANNGKFTLISAQQLAVANWERAVKRLVSPVTLARNSPALQMQLMLVQTGEIIWSGKGAVQQQ